MRFLVAIFDGKLDSSGERLTLDALKKGGPLPADVPVHFNFNRNDLNAYMGRAKLTLEGDRLYAEFDFLPDKRGVARELVPAIGGSVGGSKKEDGAFEEVRVTEVGICTGKNCDDRIHPLKAQETEQESNPS